MNKIHKFNTGRLYSEKGQRIAWVVLSTGNIGMVDVDRQIDYILQKPTQDFTRIDNQYVMQAYDSHREVPYAADEHQEFYAIKPVLRVEALNCVVTS